MDYENGTTFSTDLLLYMTRLIPFEFGLSLNSGSETIYCYEVQGIYDSVHLFIIAFAR